MKHRVEDLEGALLDAARRLRALLHRHRWRPSKVNRWGLCFERRCRCGVIQHTRVDDFSWDTLTTTWREGSHP